MVVIVLVLVVVAGGNDVSPMSTSELIFQKLFPLSLSINTLIAKGIAKHKMNVKG